MIAAVLAAGIDGSVIGLLIFAAFAFINWLAQRNAAEQPPEDEVKSDARNRRPPGTPPAAQGEDERLRKFLEALGVPQDEAPLRRQGPPPAERPLQPPPLPPVRPRPRPQAAPVPSLPARPRQPQRAAPVFKAPPDSSPIIRDAIENIVSVADSFSEAMEEGIGDEPPPRRASRASQLFSSRDDLKKAVILREVLGTPRGLQSLDAIA